MTGPDGKGLRGRRILQGTAAIWLAAVLTAGCAGAGESQPLSQTTEAVREQELPAAYDYRLNGRAPAIRDQGSLGTCWAFASLTALESTLLPEWDVTLSPDHMSLHNSFSLSQMQGGEYTMSMAYLLAWQGPVTEEEDPYGDGYSPEGLSPCFHVQEIQILPAKDYQAIKEAVYVQGGVQSSLYTSMTNGQTDSPYYNPQTSAYCYTGEEKPNHDSVIIGWDDHYPKENFSIEPEGDGAFICTNSWGTQFGDEGCFYVSYYDRNIGVHNIVYTGIQPPDNYSHIYQSDLCGWVGQIGYGQETAWFANVYQAGSRETLEAVGFYATGPNTSYQVYVAENPGTDSGRGLEERRLEAEGTLEYEGFYTISLEEGIELEPGQNFGVIVRITTPGAVHPAAIEYDPGDGIVHPDLTDGRGYLSPDGRAWEQVEQTQSCNLCLKAYTRDRTN